MAELFPAASPSNQLDKAGMLDCAAAVVICGGGGVPRRNSMPPGLAPGPALAGAVAGGPGDCLAAEGVDVGGVEGGAGSVGAEAGDGGGGEDDARRDGGIPGDGGKLGSWDILGPPTQTRRV